MKRKVAAKDLMQIRYVSSPQISSDGHTIVFVHSKMDHDRDEYLSNIWISDLGDEINQLTFGGGSNRYPKWAPNGKKILFTSTLSSEGGISSQLYTLPVSGGEAKQLTKIEGGVHSPRWSPDGTQILFISSFLKEEPKSDVRVIKGLKYKFNGAGFIEGRRDHVFIISSNGGKAKQLTQGEFDVDAAEWLMDSKKIAFISNIDGDADLTRDKYVYTQGLKGDEPTQITDGPRVVTALNPSPKGDVIAYIGHDYRRRLWSNQDIWLVPVEGGESRNMTRKFDQDIGYKLSSDVQPWRGNPNPQWSGDAKFIYFTSTYGGAVRLYRTPIESGGVETVLGDIDHSVEDWSISDNGVIAYNVVKTTSPIELWITSENMQRQITDFNRGYLDQTEISDHERFVIKSSGGHNVEGWLMRPPDFDDNTKYPMILYIRGGSAGCFGYSFMHRFQVLAAKGWVILYLNQWGNGGYNEAFQGEASGHYGEQEYRDLMDAVDHVINNNGFINPDMLGVTGISQGGFLTNWIITHDDRFKAAIPQACVSNWHSFHGTSDIGWTFGRYDMEGTPWANEEKYLSMSPIRYADKVKTPTMIIHADEDYRCSLEQAEQWFTALKILGVPTELIIFPGEPHGIRKPQHRVEMFSHMIRWFEKYLQ